MEQGRFLVSNYTLLYIFYSTKRENTIFKVHWKGIPRICFSYILRIKRIRLVIQTFPNRYPHYMFNALFPNGKMFLMSFNENFIYHRF